MVGTADDTLQFLNYDQYLYSFLWSETDRNAKKNIEMMLNKPRK